MILCKVLSRFLASIPFVSIFKPAECVPSLGEKIKACRCVSGNFLKFIKASFQISSVSPGCAH